GRSRNALGLGAGRDHRVWARGASGQPAVNGRVEASQAQEGSHRCEQVDPIGTGGSAVVVSDSAPQSGSAPGSGGTARPGRVGVGANGVDPHHARTGEKYGHTTAALFESEFRRKGKGCDSGRGRGSAAAVGAVGRDGE